ncbi:hypothetical protein HELRODRAFT_168856 [Helobdella robusta]|uniref:Uncharacterized protein n=1 Tax=Helobdella robusta TaxID=6412 RepID=T1F118_HELRO|nr:hypothetical protein HELRODRAFT_168856 [Helobdella robusta]ESO08935.1 hypothetical protein HELRODRAFT_168856 [Helobdella robusta]
MKKYGNALPSMEFLPICIEVLGPMDPNTLKFLKEICKMISVRSGDSRELFFATNHISCLLQLFLRVCVLENIQLNADIINNSSRSSSSNKIDSHLIIDSRKTDISRTSAKAFIGRLKERNKSFYGQIKPVILAWQTTILFIPWSFVLCWLFH